MPEFPFSLRFSSPRYKKPRRLFLGLYINPDDGQVQAAIIESIQQGVETGIRILAEDSLPLSYELANTWRQWSEFTSMEDSDRNFPASISALRLSYTELLVQLTGKILAEHGLSASDIILSGVLDPGLWFSSRSKTVALSSIESAVFAQQTGINVCDGFAQSDMAQSGQGGPIAAAGLWSLLNSPNKNRLLLELNCSACRLSYFPPVGRGGLKGVLSFDAAPGIDLLNQLVKRISYNSHTADSDGHLAVQGRCIAELAELWKQNPWLRTPLPRWNPGGVKANRFLIQMLNCAVEKKWNLKDILCTATCFIADCISDSVQKFIPGKIEQMYIIGAGKTNGFLIREIGRKIPNLGSTLQPPEVPSEKVLYPAAAAVLSMMFVDRVEGNLPQVTGCKNSVPLGRLTPSTEENFQRLMDAMNSSATESKTRKAA